jgi:ABC transport system ATP-binding/permease protein
MPPSTVIGQAPFLELQNQGQTLKFDLKGDRHVLGRDPQQCDLIVPPDWGVISSCHAVLKRVGSDYEIFDGDGNTKPSTNGIFANHTRITTTEGRKLSNGTSLKIGQDPRNQIQLTYRNPLAPVSTNLTSPQAIPLQNGEITIGRDPDCNFFLDSPMVSRRHAVISSSNNTHLLRDTSVNGIFANGQRISGSIALTEGMKLNIGPFILVIQNQSLRLLDSGTQIRLDAYELERVVTNQQKQQMRILDGVTLAIEPGQFVALVGGSGAGKSTLMKTLLGLDPTTNGRVLINGNDLRTNFNLYRTQIGYVPQDDIIHGDLTVLEALTYAAKLRLPPDTNILEVVNKTLMQIEMNGPREGTLINKLSGGQRKRVSIGVELLADPKLFFLDEPTSGLDPGLDKKMMQLLKKLSEQGRTIVLVTHATANVEMCDRVAFMARGGRLCYFGPPQEASDFFKTPDDDFAEIYNLLEDEDKIQHWAHRYSRSTYCDKYVRAHLSSNQSSNTGFAPPTQVKPSIIQQAILLTQRYWQLVMRDRVNLTLALITAPIGISLITLAVKNGNAFIPPETPDVALAPLATKILFVFTCASLWVGLSGALQEIVRESAIYVRERLVNLSLPAYLGSKLAVLSALAIAQTLLIDLVVMIAFKSPSPTTMPWFFGLSITSFLTLLASYCLGLLVSSAVKSIAQANSALPLLLIPQIIFSGVLFKSEGTANYISWFMLSRWSIGAYGSLVNINALIPDQKKLPDGSLLPRPLDPSSVYDPDWNNLLLNWGILLVHCVVCISIATYFQKRKDVVS